MTTPIPLIMDVDTGIDDALALALAVRSPAVELVGVSTVAGNVGIELTTENTLRVLDLLDAGDVPVYRGFSRPLARPLTEARDVHGAGGLGGYELPETRRRAERAPATTLLIDTIMASPGRHTLVCTGPLTNLAAAIALEPALPRALKHVVVMGGSLGRGNVTPYAEFNAYVDPEAAAQVYAACNVTMVGLDVTQRTVLTRATWDRLDARGGVAERLVRGVTARGFLERGLAAVPLHDPLAVALAIDPELCSLRRGTVQVETVTAWRAGQTTLRQEDGGPHAVAVGVDVARFAALFHTVLGLPNAKEGR